MGNDVAAEKVSILYLHNYYHLSLAYLANYIKIKEKIHVFNQIDVVFSVAEVYLIHFVNENILTIFIR